MERKTKHKENVNKTELQNVHLKYFGMVAVIHLIFIHKVDGYCCKILKRCSGE